MLKWLYRRIGDLLKMPRTGMTKGEALAAMTRGMIVEGPSRNGRCQKFRRSGSTLKVWSVSDSRWKTAQTAGLVDGSYYNEVPTDPATQPAQPTTRIITRLEDALAQFSLTVTPLNNLVAHVGVKEFNREEDEVWSSPTVAFVRNAILDGWTVTTEA